MALLLLGGAQWRHAQHNLQRQLLSPPHQPCCRSALLGLCDCRSQLVLQASDGTCMVYRLGDWPAPFGIVLVIDRLSAHDAVCSRNWWPCPCCCTPAVAGTGHGRYFHACSSSS
jgi:multicomponent K+:H+ antiporter subunit D